MNFDELRRHQLLKHIDQHVKLDFINKNGDPCTIFGYIRLVYDDKVIFEDNVEPDRFTIKNIKGIEPCPGGKDEEKREHEERLPDSQGQGSPDSVQGEIFTGTGEEV
jgi:hypothetical protein